MRRSRLIINQSLYKRNHGLVVAIPPFLLNGKAKALPWEQGLRNARKQPVEDVQIIIRSSGQYYRLVVGSSCQGCALAEQCDARRKRYCDGMAEKLGTKINWKKGVGE